MHDLAEEPRTTYRVIVRHGAPDEDLAKVLKPVDPADDPGDPLFGVSTRRFRFDSESLRDSKPWKNLVEHLTDDQIRAACQRLTVDTSAPASTLDFTSPGPAERVLLRRVTEELGAGRTPNTHIAPQHAARALAYAATGARAIDGNVARERILPQVGLNTDFGAVAEGHPALYAISKAAVAGLTHGLARELGPRGITVNTIQPGPVATDMVPEDGPMADTVRAMTAVGRFAQPREIGSLISYLAGSDAGFITGATLNIDGGMSI